jgi:hypothetical protein
MTVDDLTRRERRLRLLAEHYRYLARETETGRPLGDEEAMAALHHVADEDRLNAWAQHVEVRNAVDAEVAVDAARAYALSHAADRAAAGARRLSHEDPR